MEARAVGQSVMGDNHPRVSNDAVADWLLDADPSIRWQVMRDLTNAATDVVAAERSRVASEGWGRRLLDQQRPDGSRVARRPVPSAAADPFPG